MPRINVSIDGKSYRMACGEGEEEHLTGLAATLDARVAEMRSSFGEIGDMRLHVMAALTLADELTETRRKLDALESEVTAFRENATEVEAARSEREAEIVARVLRTGERVEHLVQSLAGRIEPKAG